jgi:hypothetical protein
MKNHDIADLIDSRATRQEKGLMVCEVVKVYERTEGTVGNIEVDVQSKPSITGTFRGGAPIHKFERVPVLSTDHSGHASVPSVGEWVLLDWTLGSSFRPVVVGSIYTDNIRAPLAKEGHWRHEFRTPGKVGTFKNKDEQEGWYYNENPDEQLLYLEANPEDPEASGEPIDTLRMAVKNGALEEPTTEVKVDKSDPENHKVYVNSDGDVTIETSSPEPKDQSKDCTDNDADGYGGHINIVSDCDLNLVSRENDINIEAQAQKGSVNVRTDEGDIDVTTNDGDVNVVAQTGNAEVVAGNDASITASNDIELDADNITIMTSSGPSPVAPANHTHDYTVPKTGASQQKTRTTDNPNQPGTDTEIG